MGPASTSHASGPTTATRRVTPRRGGGMMMRRRGRPRDDVARRSAGLLTVARRMGPRIATNSSADSERRRRGPAAPTTSCRHRRAQARKYAAAPLGLDTISWAAPEVGPWTTRRRLRASGDDMTYTQRRTRLAAVGSSRMTTSPRRDGSLALGSKFATCLSSMRSSGSQSHSSVTSSSIGFASARSRRGPPDPTGASSYGRQPAGSSPSLGRSRPATLGRAPGIRNWILSLVMPMNNGLVPIVTLVSV